MQKIDRPTRKEVLSKKASRGVTTFPLSLTTVSLNHEENLGFLIRAAGCFGARRVNVIGAIPEERKLRSRSVSLSEYVEVKQYKSVEDFTSSLDDTDVICMELVSNARPLSEWKPDPTRETTIVVGNETLGVPGTLTVRYPSFYIPMPGYGTCLNTAQTANIAAYHYMMSLGITGV